MYYVSWLLLVKLSVLVKWLARKTSLRTPLPGKEIISTKPRPKSAYDLRFIVLFHFILECNKLSSIKLGFSSRWHPYESEQHLAKHVHVWAFMWARCNKSSDLSQLWQRLAVASVCSLMCISDSVWGVLVKSLAWQEAPAGNYRQPHWTWTYSARNSKSASKPLLSI